jgi:hypothetical protein
VEFNSAGTQTLNSGAQGFNVVNHTGAGTLQLLTNNLTVGSTLGNSNGILDANGLTVTVTGLATVNGGTYQAKTALNTFNGGLTVNGGTFTGAAGNVDVNGVLSYTSGNFTAPTGLLSVTGDATITGGSFTAPANSTITFNGSAAGQIVYAPSKSFAYIISSNTHANGLKFSSAFTATRLYVNTNDLTASATLYFCGNATATITQFSLTGTSSKYVVLRSTTDSTLWYLNNSGTNGVTYVQVKDSDARGGTRITATNSGNFGNNFNCMDQ